jgi:FtsX-like permease family
MGAVRMLARAELRRRWRGVVVLTVLVGFSGAVVLSLVAGARRTDTALQRFDHTSRAATVELDAGATTAAQLAAFARTSGIAEVGQLHQMALVTSNGEFLPTAAQVDARFGRTIDRPRVISGRLANLHAVDELDISESLAAARHVRVGDRLTFTSWSPADVNGQAATVQTHGPRVSFRVVGIVRRPLDLGGRGAAGGVIVATPAFLARYQDEIGSFAGTVLRVRTVRGAADVPRVAHAAQRIFGTSNLFSFTNLAVEGQSAQNAIDVATAGLYLAAGVALLTALVAVAIALSREIGLADTQQHSLSALGVRSRERVAAAGAIGVPVAVGGAALAFVGAIVASPIFPIGVAAKAEPDPGISYDGLVLGLGAVAVLVVILVLTAIAAVRTARVGAGVRAPSTARLTARSNELLRTRPPVAVGVGFALDRGNERRALPAWSSLFSAAFGVTVVIAVLVFSAGIRHLVNTPSDFGWTWDFAAFDPQSGPAGPGDCSPVHTGFTRIPALADIVSLCNGSVSVAGRPVTGWGISPIRGHIEPAIVDGRAPRSDREVALGADTLSAVHRRVGDDVSIVGTDSQRTFHIVGQAVFPSITDPEPLADGAFFTARALNGLGANGGWNLVVRLAPGADRAAIARRVAPPKGVGGDVSPIVPSEIERVQQIRGLPIALAWFVALVALAAVGLGLVSSVRRHRRELAVLKTLGFTRRQLRGAVASQATTVAAVGLAVGVPVGLVAGVFVWRRVAEQLGVTAHPAWPELGVVLLVVGTVVAVNLIAAVPARRAARTRPAVVLRSE